MNRRRALKVAAGFAVGGGASLLTLTTAFKPKASTPITPQKLEFNRAESDWVYSQLDPALTADLAYRQYDAGSCMYAVVHSVISQLSAKIGEPYSSFPLHMMKYGHGGIGGFGTVCGALNGAAALMGLLVNEKEIQDQLISDLFRWYEMSPLPEFKPVNALLDFTPLASVARSTLCHASITNWGQSAGYRVKSKQRKERCRRLTGDVAAKVAGVLNQISDNTLTINDHADESVRNCMTCHGNDGKLGNTGGKMSCTSCHTESIGHRVFSDIHYKLMKKK